MARLCQHMPLALAVSHSIVKAITFDLAGHKNSFFFHWKAQSFNLMKHQRLISFSGFQEGSKYKATLL